MIALMSIREPEPMYTNFIPWLGSLPWDLGEVIVYAFASALVMALLRYYPSWLAGLIGAMVAFVVVLGAGLHLWPIAGPIAAGALFWWLERGCFPESSE